MSSCGAEAILPSFIAPNLALKKKGSARLYEPGFAVRFSPRRAGYERAARQNGG